jgi:hypothetical protein
LRFAYSTGKETEIDAKGTRIGMLSRRSAAWSTLALDVHALRQCNRRSGRLCKHPGPQALPVIIGLN